MPRSSGHPSASYQRDRQASLRRGYTWVRGHQTSRGFVRGHWRTEPGNGTVLKDDLQDHIQRALQAHAQAVSAGFADRADQIKAQLQAYANQLSRMRGGAVSG